MKNIRYFLIMLFVLAPALAFGQATSDSVVVRVDGAVEAPGQTSQFGAQFEEGVEIGPLPIIIAEPLLACEATGPLTNADEIAGNIVLISRGECAFVEKVQRAAEAGAVAAVIYNGDPNNDQGPDGTIAMGGDCTIEQGCSIPAAFVSYNNGQALTTEAEFGSEASIDPIRITAPPPPTTSGTHSTGVVELEVFDYGFIGDDANLAEPGFAFNGEPGLYASTVLVGQGGVVNSNPYAGGGLEWTSVEPVTSITPAPPYEAFDTGFTTSFDSDDFDIQVTENSYSKSGDPYVIFDLEFANTSDGAMEDVYVGIFADFDVGDFASNLGGFNEDQSLLYGYDESGTSTNYFGVAALGGVSVSGYTLAVPDPDADADLFDALTNGGDDTLPGDTAQDLRTTIGVGPFNIPAGTSISAQFAFVAGASEAEIIANAEAAQNEVILASEQTTPEGTYVLESAYPNPFASRTTIGFELPMAQDVTLTVYDVLGRKVATLVDGVRQAGPQTVEFDAASLPSGTYIYRLEAGSTQLMERLTVVR